MNEIPPFQSPASAWHSKHISFINNASHHRMMEGLKVYFRACHKERKSKSKSMIPQAELNDSYGFYETLLYVSICHNITFPVNKISHCRV